MSNSFVLILSDHGGVGEGGGGEHEMGMAGFKRKLQLARVVAIKEVQEKEAMLIWIKLDNNIYRSYLPSRAGNSGQSMIFWLKWTEG